MKIFLTILALIFAQVSFGKVKSSDFNQLIEKQAQSQNETHNALKREINSPLNEGFESDKSKIIITSQQIHIDSPEVRKGDKKVRLGSSEQIEESDFSRLDEELGNTK